MASTPVSLANYIDREHWPVLRIKAGQPELLIYKGPRGAAPPLVAGVRNKRRSKSEFQFLGLQCVGGLRTWQRARCGKLRAGILCRVGARPQQRRLELRRLVRLPAAKRASRSAAALVRSGRRNGAWRRRRGQSLWLGGLRTEARRAVYERQLRYGALRLCA